MKHNSLLIRAFTAVGVLSMLSITPFPEARAEENVSRSMDRETPKSIISTESLEACTLVSLKRVYFRYEDSNLSAEEKAALNGLVSRFASAPHSVIELRGYTDGMESVQRGTTLGTLRSQAIARYLIASGVPSERVLVVALNEISEEEKSMNAEHRRVDIRVFTTTGSGASDVHSVLNRTRQSAAAKPPKGA